MMSTNIQKTNQTTNLSAEDLEAALHLLLSESQLGKRAREVLFLNLMSPILIVIGVIVILAGMIQVVKHDYELAKILMGIGFFLGIVGRLASFEGDLGPKIKRIRKSLKETELGRVAVADWKKREEQLGGRWGLIAGLLLLIGSCWCAIGLQDKSPNLFSILLIVIAIIIGWIHTQISERREFRYFSQISQLQEQFQARLQKVKVEGLSEIAVPSAEVKQLGLIESAQLDRKIEDTAQGITQKLVASFSITIAPEPLKYLEHLTEQQHPTRFVIREIVDSLQENPRPSNVRPGSEHKDEFVISDESHEITYRIDDTKRNVNIVKIQAKDYP